MSSYVEIPLETSLGMRVAEQVACRWYDGPLLSDLKAKEILLGRRMKILKWRKGSATTVGPGDPYGLGGGPGGLGLGGGHGGLGGDGDIGGP